MRQSAIVTLAIGEPHHSRWHKYCRADWAAYAEKCNLDLIVVSEPLDKSLRGLSRSLSWQKCLVLSQDWAAPYERIVLLDSDIAINHRAAPNILEQVGNDFVGGVISGSHIQEDLRPTLRLNPIGYRKASQMWQEDQNALYAAHQLSPRPEGIIQMGVLVANPKKHREDFRSVYESPNPVESNCYEQIPLSHALLTAGLFRPIDTRFNSVFHETAAVHYPFLFHSENPMHETVLRTCVQVQLERNFFLHFAHVGDWMRYIAE
jgi:hypothetical protein